MNQSAAVVEVKKCPFCESKDVTYTPGRTEYQLRCVSCGGAGPVVKQAEYLWNEKAAVADALDAWNVRPLDEDGSREAREGNPEGAEKPEASPETL